MLGGFVGNSPPTGKASRRHHSVVVPQVELLDVTDRQRRQLGCRGLNVDALNVANIAVRTSVTPASKKRSGGTYVDEQFLGGVLLTHTEMLDALLGKKRANLDKEQAKAERALAKERAKVARLEQAEEKQRMKAKQAQERLRLKEQRDRERDQAKAQRALEINRRKIERSMKLLRLKEGRGREKGNRRCLKHDAKEKMSPTEPLIVASALV
ncbi:hypothetical protein PF005_g1357 [Phytophthora fragariae]|uniref:Uncharacterized protein n=1 Tax=Phytophthora fragariae TaxID=53985 RepID=A0A6A4EWG7_9STRA|nr:hypothetical protein PF003_g20895 [Phytophthora fragariae]KAE8949066.1 hypothetical protein PF009_g1403 [Phytophthora fragariae]KAE9029904.1 hypothetical protein PF011_g872 [Phytophthora fragariae]KAE9137988.1 hypothetical protein PF010_g1089 [Phytophthora fragariae]KAE9138515.1 hypothetical protein PF007_g1358 [Phytophthora fragariae]